MTIIDERTMEALGPMLQAAVSFAIGVALTQSLHTQAEEKAAVKRRGAAT